MRILIILLFISFIFQIFTKQIFAKNKIKYFASRIWNIRNNKWIFTKEILDNLKKHKFYYTVYYSNNILYKVIYPLFKKKIKAESIEFYDSRELLIKRENFIGKNLSGFWIFEYNNRLKIIYEKYYSRYKIFNKIKNKATKNKDLLSHYVIYNYKKNKLISQKSFKIFNLYNKFQKNKLEPFGIWKYYNKYEQLIKTNRYEINDESKGKLVLTTIFNYHSNGKIKHEKNYHNKKPFGKWLTFNRKGKLIIVNEFFDGYLSYKHKYFYNKVGKIIKKELYQKEGQINQIFHYKKGKIYKRELINYKNKK